MNSNPASAMERFEELSALLDHIWTYVESAVDTRDKAFATPAFATMGPEVRSVALRRVDRSQRELSFHTDRRSKKIGDLRAHPEAVWHAWEPEISQQFRLAGRSYVHRDDTLADQMWEGLPEDQRTFYFKASPPGTSTDKPESGIDREEVSEDAARSNFVVVRTEIEQILWLHLHPQGDYRARFDWRGEHFEGSWIIP